MSTIPCDFCPHAVDRNQMEEIEISHYVPDSSGDDLAYARTYFFGHPDCVRKFYRRLVNTIAHGAMMTGAELLSGSLACSYSDPVLFYCWPAA